jgi:hypothetical protein
VVKQVGAKKRVQAILRDPRKAIAAMLAGVIGLALLAFAATLPPAPAQYSVMLNITDTNGGVFTNNQDCIPRNDYVWLNGQLTVTPIAEIVPAPVITTLKAEAARISADVCQFTYSMTVASPSAGPLEQITGANRVPSELGLHRLSVGVEPIGNEMLLRNAGSAILINKTIAVTNQMAGLIEIGFKADWCKASAGLYPTSSWNCGWSYFGADPAKFSTNKTKGTCSGRLSFSDLRAGAVVTVAGDNGTVRGALVQADSLFSELTQRGLDGRRTSYYLYSKASEVMLCPLAWSIASVPFSPSGYTITVADRTPVYVPVSSVDNPRFLNEQQVGDKP